MSPDAQLAVAVAALETIAAPPTGGGRCSRCFKAAVCPCRRAWNALVAIGRRDATERKEPMPCPSTE